MGYTYAEPSFIVRLKFQLNWAPRVCTCETRAGRLRGSWRGGGGKPRGRPPPPERQSIPCTPASRPRSRRRSRSQRGRSRFRLAQAAPAAPRAAPPRAEGAARPHGPGGWDCSGVLPFPPAPLCPQGEPGNSLAMSAAEAGGVFRRARGRTLDAFPSGTAGLPPGEGRSGDFRLRHLPSAEPSVRPRAPPAGRLRGLHLPRGREPGTAIAAAPPAPGASRGAAGEQVCGRRGLAGLRIPERDRDRRRCTEAAKRASRARGQCTSLAGGPALHACPSRAARPQFPHLQTGKSILAVVARGCAPAGPQPVS